MKIILVEDSELIRQELVRLLSREPRLQVVATIGEEEEAVQRILSEPVDLVLLDLNLAPGSGLNVLRRIRAAGSGARVLVLSNNLRPEIHDACIGAGANGCYDKNTQVEACLSRIARWLPPLPSTEERRLGQLHELGLLELPNCEVFDNITQLAAEIAETPIALISLVEQDRQCFLSRTGIELNETSRSIAFCAHTIACGTTLEIDDAHLDPRFLDNPLVTGPLQARFYAGVPLTLTTGDALGTLCVLDSRPRQLSERQRRALKTLASSAVAEIELRRRLLELEREAERRRHAESHVLHLATRDPLTALPNRATFRDRLEQQVLLSRRHQKRFSVLFLDLDRFKPINDTLGHDAGDDALVSVAARLVGCLRESDTVARLGGDEFAILLPDIAGPAEALQVAASVITTLEKPLQIQDHTLYVGGSVGVAVYPDHGHTGEELLGHADLAMYEAKHAGGNQPSLYTAELSHRDREVRTLTVELQDALQGDQLILHYQPQITLGSGDLCGIEALVRWNHPRFGILPPGQFIELAERRGLTRQLTVRVLALALEQLSRWDAQGLHIPRIAVNVSPSDIRTGLVGTVQETLRRHGVAPTRLELEITESTLTSDGVETLQVLGQLRAMGVGIAVDDFGVGYSSLSQIHRLPIDSLKIDRSFVQELMTSSVDAAIVTAVLSMAGALNLRTVAEGVENAAQLDLLKRMGCGCVQGYLLSRPLPACDVEDWVTGYGLRNAFTRAGELPA